jgi:PAS domain S-box-containing protein
VKKTREKLFSALRQKAEAIAQERFLNLDQLSLQDAKKLIYELQVHQIELELQNEALSVTQTEIEVTYNKYLDLYNFAPAGYVTINKYGLILEANLTAAMQFGLERIQLLRQSLSRFVAEADQDTYYFWRQALFTTGEPQSCEVRLKRSDKSALYVQLTGTPAPLLEQEDDHCRVVITDVTVLKETQFALQESEERWRGLVQNIPSTVTLMDVEGRIQFVNWTRQRPTEEIIGRHILDFIPPEHHATTRQLLERVKETGEVINYELATGTPNGRVFWANQLGPIKRGGQIVELIVISTDVTEQKQAEVALEESRRFIQQVTNAAPYLVYIYDLIGQNNVYTNNQASKILGYTPEELLAMGDSFLKILLHPDDYEPHIRHLQRVAASPTDEIFESEHRVKHASGEWRWLYSRELVFSRNAAGVAEQILGTAQDITERKQLHDRLKEEHTLLRTLIDNIPDYIYIKDIESRFVAANSALARSMGAETADDMIGKTDADFFAPEVAAQFRADEEIIIQTGQPLIGKEEFLINPKGVERIHATTKVPLRDRAGQIVGLVGISRDITHTKQIEQEKGLLLEAISRQREELRALSIRLAEIQEIERQRVAQELHDNMGQNLTALGFNLNFLQTQLPDSIPNKALLEARLNNSLTLVEKTTDDIRHIIAELRPPMLDDYGLMETLDWYAARFTARTGITLKVEGEELAPRPEGPIESTLFRIVQEALTNISKHSQANQAIITVSEDDQMIQMVISDNGIGFEPALLEKRGGRPNLGLITMRERANAIGGHCRIESKPDQGTQVIVEVPR